MRQPPAARVLLLAGAVAAAGLLGGCAVDPAGTAAPSSETEGEVLPQPEVDGYAPLTVMLAVAEDEAVPGTTGRRFGCGDLLVPVRTVPAHSPDDADAALDFLFADGRGWHGDPPLWNAVIDTQETLVPTGHRREGDTEVFTFAGTVTADGECAAERIRAQLQETAAAHTSAGHVRLEVDGRDLDDVLGLAPLHLGAEVDVPKDDAGAAPSSSAEPTDPAESSWAPEEPAEPTEDPWAPTEPTEDPWAPAEPTEESTWAPEAPAEPTEDPWTPEESAEPTEQSSWAPEEPAEPHPGDEG